jgi:hypothetical protein
MLASKASKAKQIQAKPRKAKQKQAKASKTRQSQAKPSGCRTLSLHYVEIRPIGPNYYEYI